jgi:sulfite exporter TauE/SafE
MDWLVQRRWPCWFSPQFTILSTIHDPLWATVYLLIFGAGTMLGMMAMTTAMATSLTFAGQRYAAFSRYLGTVSGMVSLCFGSFLVFQLSIGCRRTWAHVRERKNRYK